jgi:hypothetical protein
MSDDRRSARMPLVVLGVVVVGIVAVSMVAQNLPHRDDRVVAPSIPVVRTSTTTTTPLSSTASTSSTSPTTAHPEPVGRLGPLSTSIGTIEFTTWRLPHSAGDIGWFTATTHGVVGVQFPDRQLVWSDDGITWSAVPVSVWPQRLATYGDDLIVYGDGGVVRLTWDGTQWAEREHLGIDGADQLAVGPGGIVAIRGGQVFYSTDGTEFHEAEQPPNRDAIHDVTGPGCEDLGRGGRLGVWPLVATDDGFIALTPRRVIDWNRAPVCGPVVWFSTDGNMWGPASEESPFGPSAYVTDIAGRDGRLVAVGGAGQLEGAVWASDDGLSWERVDVQFTNAEKLAAGARGWILLAIEPGMPNGEMWFSTDGTAWDGPYEQPEGWRPDWFVDAAVLDDRIVGRGGGEGPNPDDPYVSFNVVGEFLDD